MRFPSVKLEAVRSAVLVAMTSKSPGSREAEPAGGIPETRGEGPPEGERPRLDVSPLVPVLSRSLVWFALHGRPTKKKKRLHHHLKRPQTDRTWCGRSLRGAAAQMKFAAVDDSPVNECSRCKAGAIRWMTRS